MSVLKKTKRILKKMAIPALIVPVIYFSIANDIFIESATYTMGQGSWSSGASVDIASHDLVNNQPQQFWFKYENASTGLTIGEDMSLGTVSTPWIQTTDQDFNSTQANNASVVIAGDSVTISKPVSTVSPTQTNDSNTVAIANSAGGWGYGVFGSNIIQNGTLGDAASLRLKDEPSKTIVYVTDTNKRGDLAPAGSTQAQVRTAIDNICAINVNKPSGDVTNVKAFLSVSDTDEVRDMHTSANGIFDSAKALYWYNKSNNLLAKFANNWTDVLDGTIANSQLSGTGISDTAWSSNTGGSYDINNSCDNWTNIAGVVGYNQGHYGISGAVDATWMTTGTQDCIEQKRLRCIADYNEHTVVPTGTYSAYVDAGTSSGNIYTWNSFRWTGTYAGSSNISFKVKSSDVTTPLDFSLYTASEICEVSAQEADGIITDLSACTSSSHKYLHYEVTLNATPITYLDTPTLDSVKASVNTYSGLYSSSGVYDSAIFDTGIIHQGFENIVYNSTLPSGTNLTMRVRSCATSDCSSAQNFSTCIPVSTGQDISTNSCVNQSHTYIQYQTSFFADASRVETPSLDDVTINYKTYPTIEQELVSSKYNSREPTNIIAGISWLEDATLPANTKVTLYLRTAATAAGLDAAPWAEVASSTAGMGVSPSSSCSRTVTGQITCSQSAIPADMRDAQNDQYHQYKVGLSSINGEFTPTVVSVNVTYVINDPPEFEVDYPSAGGNGVSIALEADETISISYSVRDTDTNAGTTAGFITPSFQYSVDGGTSWVEILQGLPADALTQKVVEEGVYHQYTTVWDPKQQIPESYNAAMQIRVTADDGEGANNQASNYNINSFEIDIKKPVFGSPSFTLDASAYPNATALTINATDDTGMQMKLGFASDLSDVATWSEYLPNKNIVLATYPDTLYLQIRDAFGNQTPIQAITSLTQPVITNVQDISNPTVSEFALFISWAISGIPQGDFGKYQVYRSTQASSGYTLLTEITDTNQNYYRDGTTTQNQAYFYKVLTLDATGNISAYAVPVGGTAAFGSGSSASAPIIDPASITITNLTANTAKVSWTTDILSDSVVKYITTTGGDFANAQSQGVVSQVTDHSVILTSLNAEQIYYIQLASTDASGNTGAHRTGSNGDSFTTIAGQSGGDTTKPIIILGGVNPAVLNVGDTYSEVVSASDDTDGTITSNIVITGGPVNTSAAGTYTLKYNVQDAAGNSAIQQERVVFVQSTTNNNDTTAPVITLLGANPTNLNIGDAFTETATAVDNTDGTITSSIVITGGPVNTSAVGTYTLKYNVQDAAGNSAAQQERVVIVEDPNAGNDTTPPIITNVSTASLSASSVTIQWSTNEYANSKVFYGTDTNYSATPVSDDGYKNGARSITLSGLLPLTTYLFKVKSVDIAGLSAEDDNAGTGYTFTTLAAGSLNISNIVVVPGTTTASVQWETSRQSNSKVEYATETYFNTVGAYSDSVNSAVFTSQHPITLTGLGAETKYHYRVVSVAETDGTEVVSGDGTFTTIKDGDTIIIRSSGSGSPSAPSISDITVTNITESRALVTWKTNKTSNSLVEYVTNQGDNFATAPSQGSSEIVTEHKVLLAHLLPGTTYYIRVKSTLSSDGKTGVKKYGTGFTTLGEPLTEEEITQKEESKELPEEVAIDDDMTPIQEIQALIAKFGEGMSAAAIESSFRNVVQKIKAVLPAPVISGDPQVVVTKNKAIITWGTNKPANATVLFASASDYNIDAAIPYTQEVGNSDTLNTQHSVEILNLEPGTLYHFKVKSKSEVGKEVLSKDVTFTTKSQEPDVSEARVSYIGDTTATVSWVTNVPTDSIVKFTPFDVLQGEYDVSKMRIEGKTTFVRNHEIEVRNLIPGTEYSITVTGVNEDGVEYSYDLNGLSTSKDTAAPIISKVKTESAILPGSNAGVRSIISWSTDEDATEQLAYVEVKDNKKLTVLNITQSLASGDTGMLDNGISITTVTKDISKEHLLVLDSFKQGQTYAFRIISIDKLGNIGLGDTFVIMIPQKTESVFDMITKTFESRFKWMQR